MKKGDLERIAATTAFLVLFNLGFVALWMFFSIDHANIFISIITAEVALVLLGESRRSQIAMHAKLDEALHALKGARNELERVEDLAEEEINKRRR